MLKAKKMFILSVLAATIISWQGVAKAETLAHKEIEDIHKTWNIKFTQPVEFNDETKNNIVIKDSKGNIIETNLRLDNKNIILVDAPKEGYKEGETYTINISEKLRSIQNKSLKDDVQCKFTVKKTESKTEDVDKYSEKIDKAIESATSKVLKDGIESDWQALGVARSGKQVPESYITSLEKNLKDSNGVMGQATDYERTVLALLAVGKDPTNFAGYNLIEKIYNNNQMDEQGVNAYIYGLIALDAGSFDVPKNAVWTRDKLIKAILDCRTVDKGWDYAGDKADADMTGMALTALSKYKDRENVRIAIDEAINKLVSMQNKNGGFSSWGTENSESSSQVIIALCANGIDPTGEKFTKNGNNVVDNLLQYKTETGAYSHVKGTGDNGMATEQAIQALEAYKMFKNGCKNVYYFK